VIMLLKTFPILPGAARVIRLPRRFITFSGITVRVIALLKTFPILPGAARVIRLPRRFITFSGITVRVIALLKTFPNFRGVSRVIRPLIRFPIFRRIARPLFVSIASTAYRPTTFSPAVSLSKKGVVSKTYGVINSYEDEFLEPAARLSAVYDLAASLSWCSSKTASRSFN
jgi:hypothetical protein